MPILTPLFLEGMETILHLLYQQPYDPQRPMVNFDEKSVQLLDHVHPLCPLKPA